MHFGWTLLGTAVISVAAYLLLSGYLKTWRLYRGVRVITCPENLAPAAVRVDAFAAAKWHALAGEKDLHLNRCSRWPERAGCDQNCISQIEAAPDACTVQAIVTGWYDGKDCAFCGKAIGQIVWHERPPAVRMPDGLVRTWKEIAPQELPAIFAEAAPLCWACYTVENFRHDHPDMVIRRAREAVAHRTIPPTEATY